MRKLAGMLAGILIFPSVLLADTLPTDLQITSSAFQDNAQIPNKYTCKGGDVNPALSIKNVPAKARSLVLIVLDPDAPEGTWTHWIVYNIPPNTTDIIENTDPGTEGLSDFGKYSYGGPCPADERPHHYTFKVYALNKIININEGPSLSEVENAIQGHIIAQGKLVGTYQNP